MCANIQDLHLAVKSDVETDYKTSDFTNPMKNAALHISQDKIRY